MNQQTRTAYFRLWSAACKVKGWDAGDQEKRRAVVIDCMREVRGPLVTTSDAAFGADETTALFVFLRHLAGPGDLMASAAWDDCKTDYRAYNRAKNADWLEEQTYGKRGSGKLRRDRFNGQKHAAGEPLDKLDPEAIRKRHLTMASRYEKKGLRRRKGQEPAGQDLASQVPPARQMQPAPVDDDFDPANPFG
jgi:hypothetical protein